MPRARPDPSAPQAGPRRLASLLSGEFRRRRDLVLESLALRHPLGVPRRPAGRPVTGWPLVRLIHRLSHESPRKGAPRIHAEPLLLGHDPGVSTVARDMAGRGDPRRGQGWTTFLRNHLRVAAACDVHTVPTATIRNPFVFVVLGHDRRVIRHVAVAAHPTAEWTGRQILEASADAGVPRLRLHPNDGSHDRDFERLVHAAAILQIRTPDHSPRCNPSIGRVFGTLRRECTDHVIASGGRHLARVLREDVEGCDTLHGRTSLLAATHPGQEPVSRHP